MIEDIEVKHNYFKVDKVVFEKKEVVFKHNNHICNKV